MGTLTSAHPSSKLFPLLHFPGVAVNQEALGVAQAGHHGLLQQLQDDTLQQREWLAWELAVPKSHCSVRGGLGQPVPPPPPMLMSAVQIGLSVGTGSWFHRGLFLSAVI